MTAGCYSELTSLQRDLLIRHWQTCLEDASRLYVHGVLDPKSFLSKSEIYQDRLDTLRAGYVKTFDK